jgi:hypothetical protein
MCSASQSGQSSYQAPSSEGLRGLHSPMGMHRKHKYDNDSPQVDMLDDQQRWCHGKQMQPVLK